MLPLCCCLPASPPPPPVPRGTPTVADCACVLVAGGLGERLGYSGIKVALPTETTTGTTYLGLYCKEILALQASSNALAGTSNVVPLAIMTSDDTHQRTVDLLAANGNFGMAEGQVRESGPGAVCPLQPD
jgi:UDP-sugar pyrophosphorylase